MPRNAFDVEDNAYESLVLVYSKELDIFVSTSSITGSDVEEENSPPSSKDPVIDSEEETTNLEDTTPITTPQFTMGVPGQKTIRMPIPQGGAKYYIWGKVVASFESGPW